MKNGYSPQPQKKGYPNNKTILDSLAPPPKKMLSKIIKGVQNCLKWQENCSNMIFGYLKLYPSETKTIIFKDPGKYLIEKVLEDKKYLSYFHFFNMLVENDFCIVGPPLKQTKN